MRGLFVDANGAYSRKQALAMAERFAEFGVSWFEEPVTSDDLEGLRLMRDRAPAGMDIAAGEYGYDLVYFKRMLDVQAVDVQQADASRCAGISEFLRVGALCDAANMPMSAHTSPSLHLHPCCALSRLRNIEYFHDHVRIEKMFFDGRHPACRWAASSGSCPGRAWDWNSRSRCQKICSLGELHRVSIPRARIQAGSARCEVAGRGLRAAFECPAADWILAGRWRKHRDLCLRWPDGFAGSGRRGGTRGSRVCGFGRDIRAGNVERTAVGFVAVEAASRRNFSRT